MTMCAMCGLTTTYDNNPNAPEICPHHMANEDGWAAGNKILCDFFHRRIVPKRPPLAERDDDFWARTGEADAGI